MSNTDHVTYDWRTGMLECQGCGDRYQLTLPVPVTIETSVAKEYVRLHRKHKPKPVMP